MSDLVERLRIAHALDDDCQEAADEIERLSGVTIHEPVATQMVAALTAMGWQKVEPGFAVVPEEPTSEMKYIGFGIAWSEETASEPDVSEQIYRAMINAAKQERQRNDT
jgi:hypothetical protein